MTHIFQPMRVVAKKLITRRTHVTRLDHPGKILKVTRGKRLDQLLVLQRQPKTDGLFHGPPVVADPITSRAETDERQQVSNTVPHPSAPLRRTRSRAHTS